MPRTKIVCTIGPATNSPEKLRALMQAGMNVARINFSHGNQDTHRETVARLREVAREEDRLVGIIADLQGPKLRVGDIKEEPVALHKGDVVTLSTADSTEGEREIPVPHPALLRELNVGQTILLDDGNLALTVERHSGGSRLEARVVAGGPLTSHKGINVPGARLSFSTLTEKDKEDAAFALEQGVDYFALSFVRRSADIRELRHYLKTQGGEAASIIAKIEKPEALSDFDGILNHADGIMVARGDLGVETPAEEVPFHQKEIIRSCNRAGKPVITATQMLQSMMQHPRPTRAEASDIANAILDGTDAVMLSGETAVGNYPVEATETMATICGNAEAHLPSSRLVECGESCHEVITEAISSSAVAIAEEVDAHAIVTATMSGTTARMVARHRPSVPIVAVTPNEKTLYRLALMWGVVPVQVDEFKTTDEMVKMMIEAARREGLVAWGDRVVLTAGIPFGHGKGTNMLKVHVIGESEAV
jgi:pyruvate kinase